MERPNLDQTEAGDGVSILRRLKSRQMLLLIALHEVKSLRKAAARTILSLPLHPGMTDEQARLVAAAVRELS